jgi:signal transduction histidine kinase
VTFSAADAAPDSPPGAWPGQRAAGSALALRNWRVARRLIALVAIPTLLGLALAGLRVTDAMRSAEAYGQVDRLAVVGQQVTGLAQAMEDERADTAAFIAAGRPASGRHALHRGYAVTNRWAARTRRLAVQLGRGYPARTQAGAAAVLASIADLPGLRRRAAQSQAGALTLINGYSAAIAGLFPVNDGIADLSGSSALTGSVRALGALSRMGDQASQQQAILGVALAEGRLGPGPLNALIVAQAQQASDVASFRSSASPEESWALADTLARPLARQAQTIERRATAAGAGRLALSASASQQWSAGMSYTVGWMRGAQQQLAGWIAAYAQSLQRGAMRSAMITGGAALAGLILILLVTLIIARSLVRPLRRLEAAALGVAEVGLPAEVRALRVAGNSGSLPPVTSIGVQSTDEIGRVARAVDRVHREAVRLAEEEARLRGGTGAIYASFFRRSHFLLERLLRLIDSLELGEDDPERLATLFQMDHLATRLRRNSDSTLVLAGHESPHHWTEPVTLVDLLRAAVSEIEQYDRVVLDVQTGASGHMAVSVSGSAVADTAHLLAELLDNATTFSPKPTQVVMSASTVRGDGALISIADSGTGMPPEQLGQLNWQLAHSHLTDVTVAPHLGLFAVARLAARHGITVRLGLSPDGGTTAEVHVPAALISPDAQPSGWPEPAGQALPEIAVPGAVPLTLAAPVPAPAAPVSFTSPGPERANAEPSGPLPIFESLESEYLHGRGQDLLGPAAPQAGQPTPAGQPDPASPACPGDSWRGAAARSTPVTPAVAAVTSAGLPQRIPQGNRVPPVPPVSAEPDPRPATTAESAQIAASRLASFQRGLRRARAVTRIDRDARQSFRDD